jgi:endonuclease VIII
VPEGDTLHRVARRLQPLVGETVEVETPHPRAAVKGIAERLNGRRLESVEAVGKNLLLRFDDGAVLRSHLGMRGRWRLERRGRARVGRPWLVLRGRELEAVLWNGTTVELSGAAADRIGPDILDDPPDLDRMVSRIRAGGGARPVGETLLDQRLVAGIGNLWRAEALWAAGVSPWRPLAQLTESELRTTLTEASRLMRASLEGGRPPRRVYRRVGRPCGRCGTPIRSRGLGDANRTAYWCPGCQA